MTIVSTDLLLPDADEAEAVVDVGRLAGSLAEVLPRSPFRVVVDVSDFTSGETRCCSEWSISSSSPLEMSIYSCSGPRVGNTLVAYGLFPAAAGCAGSDLVAYGL